MKTTRVMMAVIASVIALTMTACSGCAATNPFKSASGVDEQAYAVLGSYSIYQRQALKVVQDTSLPANVRTAVAQADAVAFPILKSVDAALTQFLDAKAALDAGTSTQQKFAIAVANLKDWVERGRTAVGDLKAAAANAKKTFAFVQFDDYAYGSA